ncbi:probable protein phosphatase 2C 55 [Telopea speciosissima]|uniref:probable protein phosphatase 2C 55 n=1 Tax=Telopea speciosissima TaxID=54955 RepID=UPI001CC50AB0|nr:probable protein phosphatase 2C 55 [Telopea speciosissima]
MLEETERPTKLRRLCDSDTTKKSLKLIMDFWYLPKENELNPQGEDSLFICDEEQVFGVADGVGGWAKKGIDAGKYARELMLNAAMAVKDGSKGSVNPYTVLEEAYSKTKALGSSTACIVALTDDNFLHSANVGDSGFMVIRGDNIIYKSEAQQYRFNCPLQLGNHPQCDRPSSGYEFKVAVEDGDVIVAGTDGLFDNLFEENIIEIVKEVTGCIGIYPYRVAQMIAESAKISSEYNFLPTPFSLEAEMAGYLHSGGKIDDITVLVAFVISSPLA